VTKLLIYLPVPDSGDLVVDETTYMTKTRSNPVSVGAPAHRLRSLYSMVSHNIV
jgi:hypothetical protein